MPNYQQLIPLLALAFNSGGAMVRVTDYWPEVADDLTRVSWSHATNSKALLDQALADSTMMIEADVSLGPGSEPIMAHPPANTSDLSLRQFLDFVLARRVARRRESSWISSSWRLFALPLKSWIR